jgi:hypothetical protein
VIISQVTGNLTNLKRKEMFCCDGLGDLFFITPIY